MHSNIDKKEKIIVCALANIGDFVWATSAISLIKQTNRDCELALVTFDLHKSLIDFSLSIDKLFFIKKKYYSSNNIFIKSFYRVLFCIKNFFSFKKYDTIIFLDQPKFAIFELFSKYIYKIKKIVGPDKFYCGYNKISNNCKYYTNIISMPVDSNKVHIMMRYQIVIRSFLKTYNLSLPILPDTSFLKDEVNKLIGKKNKYNIAICLMGTNELNFWKVEYWAELISKILNFGNNMQIFIIGSGEEQNRIANRVICLLSDKHNIKNLINETTLMSVKELLKYMDVLISADTGIVHLAAVSKIPTLTLYGPTLPISCGPINYNAREICLYKHCSPCYYDVIFNNKICNKNECLLDISPEEVFKEFKNILNLN